MSSDKIEKLARSMASGIIPPAEKNLEVMSQE